MPIYEYRCDACGRTSEVIQAVNDPPLAACPHCGGAVRKLASAPAFQFKGSGWYATDYARKGAGESARARDGDATDGAAAAASGGTTEGAAGGEAKGAAIEEPKSAAKGAPASEGAGG
jgi:putative FmdB family regulatory protein